jgi:hypothetical protein
VTLLLLTGCIVNTVIPETAIENLENQENTEEPVMLWSGLGMGLFSTANTSEFDGYVDDLLANGFTDIRLDIVSSFNSSALTISKSAVAIAVGKGVNIIWGVCSGDHILTSSNWATHRQGILNAAQWAQDNGVYEFQLGNEEERCNDDTTLTDIQLITNLKSVAADVQKIFTRGKISYTCDNWYIVDWITAGKGDIDILASNVYMGYGSNKTDLWKTQITNLVNAFGVDGTYLTEFGPNSSGLDYYSTDEAVQATGVAEMIDYIKASGITRAFYFCYKNPFWQSDLHGARKDDDTYRLLWNQALLNTGPVESTTVLTKTTTISLPDTIALIPK